MPYDDDEYEEEPEEEPVEEAGVQFSRVSESSITGNENPHELGWYEIPDIIGDGTGAVSIPDPFITEDTEVVPGKAYYVMINYEGGIGMSEALAYSTYQTYLMYRSSTSNSYANVIPIKDYPDMMGDPNMLDCTTLSDSQEKQIAGILRLGDGFQFTANYTPGNFSTVKALEGHQYEYALWLGGTSAGTPDGHNGKFEWTGDVRAGFPGKGVDEVQDMTITATPSTDVKWSAGT